MGDYPQRSTVHGSLSEERRKNRVKDIRQEDLSGSTLSPVGIAGYGRAGEDGLANTLGYDNLSQYLSGAPTGEGGSFGGSHNEELYLPSGPWLTAITVIADPQNHNSSFTDQVRLSISNSDETWGFEGWSPGLSNLDGFSFHGLIISNGNDPIIIEVDWRDGTDAGSGGGARETRVNIACLTA